MDDDAGRQAEEAVEPAHPLGVALGEVVVDGDDVHALARERVQVASAASRRGSCPRRSSSRRSCRRAAPCRRSAARRSGACRARACSASRTTANASGRMSSSVAPLSSRCLNSAVFALSSASVSALTWLLELVDPVDDRLELPQLALVLACRIASRKYPYPCQIGVPYHRSWPDQAGRNERRKLPQVMRKSNLV